jgi:hypothetical protein
VEPIGKKLSFEVDWDIGEVCRRREAVGFEQRTLPLLCGGVVDFEDAKVRVRVAVAKGVEACSEEDVLGDSVCDGVGERVFGVAAASDEEGAEGDGEGLVEFGGGAVDLGKVFPAEDGDGDGIVKDEWLRVVELVRRATQSDPKCGSGGASFFHSSVERGFARIKTDKEQLNQI